MIEVIGITPMYHDQYRGFITLAASLLVYLCSAPLGAHSRPLFEGGGVQQLSADHQCGADRSCRLERLKRLKRQRELSKERARTQRAIKYQSSLDNKALRKTPREIRPYSVNISSLSNDHLSQAGFEASWQWMKHLQVLGAYYPNNQLDFYDTPSFETYQSGQSFKAGVRYLNSVKHFTTYFELYALHLRLEGWLSQEGNDSYFNDVVVRFSGDPPPADVTTSAEGELESHLLGVGVGFDWQASNGFHLRLGVNTHLVLYASHRRVDTRENLVTRDSAPKVVSEASTIMYDFAIGYSF